MDMNRVSLIIDDYSELMFVQIILKKLGFDVDALQNIHTLADHLLTFHPSLIILTEDGRRFSAENVMKQIKAQLPDAKFLLLKARAVGTEKTAEGVLRIGSPIQPNELIRATSQSFQLDPAGLLEKFKKFRGQLNLPQEQQKRLELQENDEEQQMFAEAKTESASKEDPARENVYRDYLKKKNLKVKETFRPEEIQKFMRDEKMAAASAPLDTSVDNERRSFVTELFRKK